MTAAVEHEVPDHGRYKLTAANSCLCAAVFLIDFLISASVQNMPSLRSCCNDMKTIGKKCSQFMPIFSKGLLVA